MIKIIFEYIREWFLINIRFRFFNKIKVDYFTAKLIVFEDQSYLYRHSFLYICDYIGIDWMEQLEKESVKMNYVFNVIEEKNEKTIS